MEADDLIGCRIHDHLVEHPLIAVGEHILHRPEVGHEDPDVAHLVTRLGLGHADAGQQRMAEYRTRDATIVYSVGRPAEHRIGKRVAFAYRDRCQLHAIGNVAHGINAPAGRLAILIDYDRALIVDLDARRLQPKIRRVRHTSGRENEQVAGDRIAPLDPHANCTVHALLDLFKRRIEAEVDSLRHADLQKPVADGFVIFTQDRIGAVYDRHMRAEPVEDTGELIGNIAATDDHHALGQGVQAENLVGSDAVLGALDFWNP